MKHFRESADQLTKLRQSSSSLDDYYADRSIPDLGLGGSWIKDMDMICAASPGQTSTEKVESWINSLTPLPFLARWASDASLSEAIDEPTTPLSPHARHMKRRYISQVEYDTHLEKRVVRIPSDPQMDYNGNVSKANQNADLLGRLLEQSERVKHKSLDDEEDDEPRDEYFDEYFDDDSSQHPDAP